MESRVSHAVINDKIVCLQCLINKEWEEPDVEAVAFIRDADIMPGSYRYCNYCGKSIPMKMAMPAYKLYG